MSQCKICFASHRTTKALYTHYVQSNHWLTYCTQCERQFGSNGALRQHQRDSSAHDDDDSLDSGSDSDDDPWEDSARALYTDWIQCQLAYCEQCDRTFKSAEGLRQHRQDAAVHQADDSESSVWESDNESSDDDTSDDESNVPVSCRICGIYCANHKIYAAHCLDGGRHEWCSICKRAFGSDDALKQHLRTAPIHKTSNHDCPSCGKAFDIPSALAMHIESGVHKVNRHQVTYAVHSLKVVPRISVAPIPARPILAIVHYSANERAFNGSAYECYICHRTFASLGALNQHLASPVHDADQFKCPKCKSLFTVISAFMQHIESECCGVARFQQVQDYASLLTNRFLKQLKM